MMIYLLRHGRAEIGFGKRDADRTLTAEGLDRLRAAAPTWGRLIDNLDVVVTSPYRRAQQTAAILRQAIPREPELRTDASITPMGELGLAMDLITDALRAETQSLAFVGHEPHLGELLGLLLTGEPRGAMPLKKGMLVAVDLARPTSLVGTLRFALSQRDAATLAQS